MNNQQVPQSERQLALGKVENARKNLLLMIGLTVINLVLLVLGQDVMMLFSATVPYYVAVIGVYSGFTSLMVGGIAIAVVILVLYLLCWFFSKKHYGWMIAALVLFSLDTLFLIAISVLAGDFSGILDFVIHIWVFYYLIIGVKYGRLLKTLPEETFEQPAWGEENL